MGVADRRLRRVERVAALGGIALALLFACSEHVPGASATQRAGDRRVHAAAPGIWIGPGELKSLPTSGAAWEAMRQDAARDPGVAAITDQHSLHDTYTMAAALVCARTGEYCAKARRQLLDAIGSEAGADWHSVARNLGAYVIAADVMGLRRDGDAASDGTRMQQWIAGFLTRTDIRANAGEAREGTRGIEPFHSGSNSAAQEGFVHAAVAAYLADRAALDRSWDAFRTYACDPAAPRRGRIDLGKGVETGWSHDDASPCAVNPKGTTKRVPRGRPGAGRTVRLDGAIINDMRRGGDYQWPPGFTQYPWVGLEGFVPAAVILHRRGYPAFDVADRAVLRTLEYLWYLRVQTGREAWFDGTRADEIVFLVNRAYGVSFPVVDVVRAGRLVGYTDWSHMTWRR